MDGQTFSQWLGSELIERNGTLLHHVKRDAHLELDDHQHEAIDEVIQGLQDGLKAFSIVHACGTGKSVVAAHLVGTAQDIYDAQKIDDVRDVLLGIDRANVGRLYDELTGLGLDVGRWGDGKKQLDHPVVIASIQALQMNAQQCRANLGRVGLLIGDEADCYLTKARAQIIRNVDACLRVGFTATPTWPDGRDISSLWGPKISQLPLIDSIRRQITVPPIWTLFQSRLEGEDLPIASGDFKRKELGAACKETEVHLAVNEVYATLVPEPERLSTLALICVPSAELVHLSVRSFQEQYPELVVHGWTGESVSSAQRQTSEHAAREGQVQILVFCEMGGRALDLPNASVLIDAYSTLSRTKLEQRISRVLRRKRDGSKQWATIAQIVPKTLSFRPVCVPDLLNDEAWEEAQQHRPLGLSTKGDVGAPVMDRVKFLRDRIAQMGPSISVTALDTLDLYSEMETVRFSNLKTWSERYADLQRFRQEHADRWPQQSAKEEFESSLAQWLRVQRAYLRDGVSTVDQQELLAQLGVGPADYKQYKSWEERYQELFFFRQEHSDRWPSRFAEEPSERSLASWVRFQRTNMRDALLTADQMAQLAGLGLEPTECREQTNQGRHYTWEERIEELKAFRTAHPDRWPSSMAAEEVERSLGIWLADRKTALRQGRLPPERAESLQSTGVDVSFIFRKWEVRFAELKNFRKEHPDRWPNGSIGSEAGLQNWLMKQRILLRDQKLAPEKRDLLIGLGIEPAQKFEGHRHTLNERLQQLRTFRQEHPDQWPSSSALDSAEQSLAAWLENQRAAMRKGNVSDERLQILSELGVSAPVAEQPSAEKRLKDLSDFRAAHPDRWPYAHSDNEAERSLAFWLSRQRVALREGTVPPEEQVRLEELGVMAAEAVASWEDNLRDLRAFRESYPDRWPSTLARDVFERKLGKWLNRQRTKLRRNQLQAEQKAALEAIGVSA